MTSDHGDDRGPGLPGAAAAFGRAWATSIARGAVRQELDLVGGTVWSTRAISDPRGTTMTAALSDLRVVEMGLLLAGPFCGQLLADFGADVIKLEPLARATPCGSGVGEGRRPGRCGLASGGPGKRSVTINPAGEGTARTWPDG